MLQALSLFSGSGIGEILLDQNKIHIEVSNEYDKLRAKSYKHIHRECNVICGDIRKQDIRDKIYSAVSKVDIIIATPPCQGVSSLGKNKTNQNFVKDERNYLIFDFIKVFKELNPNYAIIENTERFGRMLFPFKGKFSILLDILNHELGNEYNIYQHYLNCKDYGVAQSRPRVIYTISRANKTWILPEKEPLISLRNAISHLPSLEPGDNSGIKWHYAKKHKPEIIECLRYTPEGKSALTNQVHYPKNKFGKKISGFHNTYKRMKWEAPCPARTTCMGSPSSHNNVHPGRLTNKGLYSDPRVLTLLETFIVSSIPTDISFPDFASDNFIRTVIGEGVPPLFLKKILDQIND